MSVFLADISSYEHGLRIADLTDCVGVLLKCTEGTYYTDADYAGWLAQAKTAGKIPIVYHFISGEDPDAQAAHLAAHIGDPSLPVMLDWEPTGSYRPTLAQLYAVADAMARRGLRVRVAYVPRWYWAQIGGPDLSGLTARRIGMVSSAYPGGSGTAAQLYPGDGAAGWQPYGSLTPLLYQFTDQAADGGQRIDMNAYKGSAVALAAFLGTATPTPPGGTDMTLTPAESQQLAEIHQSSVAFANWQFYAPPGREQVQGTHAWRMQTTLDTTAAISAKVDQLLARSTTAPVVDVVALAAALGPHIAATTDVGQLAADLIPHLPNGVDLQALADAIVAAVGSKLTS